MPAGFTGAVPVRRQQPKSAPGGAQDKTSVPPQAASQRPAWWGEFNAGNWISLVALVLSLLTAGWQIAGFIAGPRIEFVAPSSITFRYMPYGRREPTALSATSMNYLNNGRKDYDGLVLDETATLRFAGRNVSLSWWWFLSADGSATEQAHPVVVPGAGLTSHETRFVPLVGQCKQGDACSADVPYDNFLPWSEFLSLATAGTAAKVDVEFNVTIRERGLRTFTHRCRVTFDESIRKTMSDQKQLLAMLHGQGLEPADIDKRKDFYSFFSLPCVAL